MNMFKLPVCPHCGTIYRYKDVKKELEKKKAAVITAVKNLKYQRKNF